MINETETSLFKNYLQRFPGFSESAFDVALPYFKYKNLAKGDFLIQQGKTANKIAFILTGLFRTFYLKDGLEVTTCFCKENTLTTSYKSLITKLPSELSIQALENATVLIIQYTDLQELFQKHPFWQQAGRMVAEQEFVTAECYTRFLNDKTARERYLDILNNEPDLLQRAPLLHLASYLQITPETLSRIRKDISTS